MSTRRAQSWVIELTPRGTVILLHGGRALQQDIPLGTAVNWVKKKRVKNERVFRTDEDGYRVDITRTFPEPA